MAFISSTVIPFPCIRINCSVKWRFFCLSILIGSASLKVNGLWLLGVSVLDQSRMPLYIFDVYAVGKLTLLKPRFSNWRFNSCSARATVLLLITRLQESIKSSGTVSLSMADANKSILIVDL